MCVHFIWKRAGVCKTFFQAQHLLLVGFYANEQTKDTVLSKHQFHFCYFYSLYIFYIIPKQGTDKGTPRWTLQWFLRFLCSDFYFYFGTLFQFRLLHSVDEYHRWNTNSNCHNNLLYIWQHHPQSQYSSFWHSKQHAVFSPQQIQRAPLQSHSGMCWEFDRMTMMHTNCLHNVHFYTIQQQPLNGMLYLNSHSH